MVGQEGVKVPKALEILSTSIEVYLRATWVEFRRNWIKFCKDGILCI